MGKSFGEKKGVLYFDISIANALELLQSCPNPSISSVSWVTEGEYQIFRVAARSYKNIKIHAADTTVSWRNVK